MAKAKKNYDFIEVKEVSLDQVQELMDFLQGVGLPEGISITKHKPKLSVQKSATVLWFLQEHMGLIPSNFEVCDECGKLYDDYAEGYYSEIGDKWKHNFCGDCYHLAPEIVLESLNRD